MTTTVEPMTAAVADITPAATRPAPLPDRMGNQRGGYRLYTHRHLPFDAFDGHAEPSLSTVTPWACSTSGPSFVWPAGVTPTKDEAERGRYIVNAFQIMPDPNVPGGKIVPHAIDGTPCTNARDARRLQYEAGLLAWHVYEDDRQRLGIAFRRNAHTNASGDRCSWSHTPAVTPEYSPAPDPRRCPAGCTDSDIEAYINPDLAEDVTADYFAEHGPVTQGMKTHNTEPRREDDGELHAFVSRIADDPELARTCDTCGTRPGRWVVFNGAENDEGRQLDGRPLVVCTADLDDALTRKTEPDSAEDVTE